MVHTTVTLLSIGRDNWLRERLYVQIQKFIGETLDYLLTNNLLDDFMPRINKACESLRRIGAFANPLSRIMDAELSRIQKLREAPST